MIARALAGLMAGALFCAAQPAGAELVADARFGYQLDVAPAWKPAPELAGGDVVTAWRNGDAVALLVRTVGSTEASVTNEKAWLAAVERGVKSGVPGYTRVAARKRMMPRAAATTKAARAARIFVWDLSWRGQRDARPVAGAARFLFRGTYTMSLVIDTPGRKLGPASRALLDSFRPL